MSKIRSFIISANEAERKELSSEVKSQLTFFLLFGGGFAIAATITIWPPQNISSLRWMVFLVLCSFFAGFTVLYVYQSARLRRDLAAAKSLMYVGHVTRKEKIDTDDTVDYRIWIEDRPFDVGEYVFDEVKIGSLLAVREWIGSGDYIEHTLDAKYIAELERRAVKG